MNEIKILFKATELDPHAILLGYASDMPIPRLEEGIRVNNMKGGVSDFKIKAVVHDYSQKQIIVVGVPVN